MILSLPFDLKLVVSQPSDYVADRDIERAAQGGESEHVAFVGGDADRLGAVQR